MGHWTVLLMERKTALNCGCLRKCVVAVCLGKKCFIYIKLLFVNCFGLQKSINIADYHYAHTKINNE